MITHLYGTKITSNIQDQAFESPLSATQAGKGLGANLTHSFSAAFAQQIVHWAGEHQVPVIANHDCFAVQHLQRFRLP